MALSPFHALYKARALAGYASGQLKLVAAYAASNIEVYPYQIAAAQFALRSPYLKGCILCDEGSLGKSIEAMLIITQAGYEGRQRVLIVVPTPLIGQWAKMMDEYFSIPFCVVDTNAAWDAGLDSGAANPFEQDGIILTTYEFAAEKAEYISRVVWHMAVFEEAHHLRRIYRGENKNAAVLRQAVGGAFKLLLTATPMQNSIMDLYGLIYFIDEAALPDADSFYRRYFRKPEHYAELAERASKFCFRTTRPQVSSYVKIPERIVVTADYTLTPKEQALHDILEAYLDKPVKIAFPKMERYDLTLMLLRTFSSSTAAIAATLSGIVARLEKLAEAEPWGEKEASELAEFRRMLELAGSISTDAKGHQLLAALKDGFARLKKLGAQKKALIFTENRATQKYLFQLLDNGPYKGKVLTFNGDKSRDYSIMERFAQEAQILIATDIAAEGFNLEFCSFVINYDLPYNTLTIEQRISRCHRQGQQSDVLVLNFLNRNNFADVRMLELVNKRILQFGGIFGMADNVVGGFGVDLSKDFAVAMGGARTKAEIDAAYRQVLVEFEDENKQLVEQAEIALFTSFTREIADGVTLTPQYIQDKSCEINNDLWEVTKYFLNGKSGYTCIEETRTVQIGIQPQKIFTGAHLGRREYSMTDKTLPKSGWHTITGTLAKNILSELFWRGIPDSGSIVVDGDVETCTIGYYRVKVKAKSDYFSGWYYNVLVGRTASGQLLTHDECVSIMDMPVLNFTVHGDIYGERDGISKPKHPHELDALVMPDEWLRRTAEESDAAVREAIDEAKARTSNSKIGLQKAVDALRGEVKAIEAGLERSATITEKVKAEKRKVTVQKELRQREQTLFMENMRLDVALEEEIQRLTGEAQLTAEVKREFVIGVRGKRDS